MTSRIGKLAVTRLLLALAAVVPVTGLGMPKTLPGMPPLVLDRGRELVKDPSLFVRRTVTVIHGFCFFDQPSFVCIGKDTPFEVRARSMPGGPLLEAIKDQCGDINGVEHNPVATCAFSFRFVPTGFKYGIGDYFIGWKLQSNRRLVFFDAAEIEPMKP
jgi:hypothetical protein